MTSSLSLRNIYVEGDDDVAVLSRWFPQLTFVPAEGKDEVQRRVAEDRASYGLLDRDFASDEEEQLRWQLTIEAIYHTNRIEGNQLTLPEVRAIVEAFWAEYPTRRDRSLKLKTDPHTYDQRGTYHILVKVIDIFGIDTSQLFEVTIAP